MVWGWIPRASRQIILVRKHGDVRNNVDISHSQRGI